MTNGFSWERFDSMPIVGIMRNVPERYIDTIACAYSAAGMSTLEVTMNSKGAKDIIRTLVDNFGDKINIGAGTVCNMDDLENALHAGAQFVVTPILDKKVVSICVKLKIPIFCGAYTPTEIYKAWQLGADMVKIFPASQLGPAYVKEVLAPLNQIKLLPTGGISPQNFTDYLTAGAGGVGMGSHLFPADLLQNKNGLQATYQNLTYRYKAYQQDKL